MDTGISISSECHDAHQCDCMLYVSVHAAEMVPPKSQVHRIAWVLNSFHGTWISMHPDLTQALSPEVLLIRAAQADCWLAFVLPRGPEAL